MHNRKRKHNNVESFLNNVNYMFIVYREGDFVFKEI